MLILINKLNLLVIQLFKIDWRDLESMFIINHNKY